MVNVGEYNIPYMEHLGLEEMDGFYEFRISYHSGVPPVSGEESLKTWEDILDTTSAYDRHFLMETNL